MIDIELIRKNPELVKDALKKRGADVGVDYIREVDTKRLAALRELEKMRAEQNEMSAEYSKAGEARRTLLVINSKELKDKIGHKEFELKTLEDEVSELLKQIPNLPLPEVPPGVSEKDNVVLHEVGDKPDFEFEPLNHVALGTSLDILDFESGAKVSGSGFYYLKNEGVLLELALVQYALDILRQRGFVIWLTPDLAREQFYVGTGYLPRGPEAQTYEVKDSDLGLIATSEVTLAGIHAGEILEEKDLPLRYAGYSHCFRQEAGSYGKYSRGLYRVHQFSKVEMFVYARPEDSAAMHEKLLSVEETLWQGLKIPYRVVGMCAGDLGTQAARKIDLEAWMPGRGDWGEVTSASNTTDYQSRNLGIRYRRENGENGFVHTLNGTAIATSRAIIAILENYQEADGSVRIPEALRPYMLGVYELRRHS
ncbi:MAG: serine--tRNA ligase [Candidatus Sungbacteria bacterium]|uniref:Serine--tRNA ligase n=1 Tax=Candidatus Sungiibacteriota bacterium TaxID=2750080 RepID=A0A931WNB8_9BACT|nr:serine--tRNA ligase [Candidatus Sungbacteria bacterium]